MSASPRQQTVEWCRLAAVVDLAWISTIKLVEKYERQTDPYGKAMKK